MFYDDQEILSRAVLYLSEQCLPSSGKFNYQKWKTAPSSQYLKARRKWLENKYKITPEEFEALWIRQNGLCAICTSPIFMGTRNTAVDHDHNTGKIRGLLCSTCNTGLGQFQENEENIKSAIRYLSEYNYIKENHGNSKI